MSGEFDDIRQRLEAISEELSDLAIARLRESIDAGGDELPVDEKRLTRARRAVEQGHRHPPRTRRRHRAVTEPPVARQRSMTDTYELSDVERLSAILDDVIRDWDERDKVLMHDLFVRAGQAGVAPDDEVSGYSISWAPAGEGVHALPPGPCDNLFASFQLGNGSGFAGRAQPPAASALITSLADVARRRQSRPLRRSIRRRRRA